ncbi:hypothetical protein KBI33_03055 [Candidatus Shapirobacteria bacterium]|nr:hypothetical protein [Candidatus Shapirobacteria bacterium]
MFWYFYDLRGFLFLFKCNIKVIRQLADHFYVSPYNVYQTISVDFRFLKNGKVCQPVANIICGVARMVNYFSAACYLARAPVLLIDD